MDESRLISSELRKHLPSDFLNRFSLFTNESELDINKELIYWCQLYDDSSFIRYMKDVGIFDKIKCFIFVSNWQSELYREKYNIPGEKVKIIKNACYSLLPTQLKEITKTKQGSDKIKICYANAPWKGLRVLLSAWEKLNRNDCELDILYHNIDNIDMSTLNESCQNYNNVKFIESSNYGNILQNICRSHIMVYTPIYKDVSNIYLSDALSNGIRVVTTSSGALPEITEGWARLYPYIENEELHAKRVSIVLNDELKNIRSNNRIKLLQIQKNVYGSLWGWNNRMVEWNSFISNL